MLCSHFDLTEPPFSIAPDPRFLFLSDGHREALAHLVHGVTNGGLVLLTGEVGTGKTVVCRTFLSQLPDHCEAAFIFNPRLTDIELLATICDEFRISYPSDVQGKKILFDRIYTHLLDRHALGKSIVLVIDEAQNLSVDGLEQIRLLTNLETSVSKLLQIILVGQPELRTLLAQPALRQLSQRITARYHLQPLSKSEVTEYVNHRVNFVGANRPLFESGALRLLHKLSGGIPRLVNIHCDRALLGAAVQGRSTVDRHTMDLASREVCGGSAVKRPQPHQQRSRDTRSSGQALGFAGLAIGAIALALSALSLVSPEGVSYSTVVARVSAAWSALVSEPEVEPKPKPDAAFVSEPATQPASVATDEMLVAKSSDSPKSTVAPAYAPIDAPFPHAPGPDRYSAEEVLAAFFALQRGTDPFRALVDDSDSVWSPEPPSWRTAFNAVLSAWRLPAVPEEIEPCEHVVDTGLVCLHDWGTLKSLSTLNRPAVVRLDVDGRSVYGAVTKFDKDTILVVINGDQRSWNYDQFRRAWDGEFSLLWQPPPGYRNPIAVGERGPLVRWLRTTLASSRGGAQPASESDVFDQSLLQDVIAFQRANGLTPDGLVGPRTIIRLNTAAASASAPRR